MKEWFLFNDHKFTILNESSQQLNQYQHSWQSGVINNSKSIIFTELEDYMHESLRLWKTGFFNDKNFTILNKWSQQLTQYQHCRQSGVNNNTKFYYIYWVRVLQARISTIINEWYLQWPKVTICNEWSQRCSQHKDSLQNRARDTKIL